MHEVTILLENGRNNDLIETCRKYREQQLNKWNSSEESHFDHYAAKIKSYTDR